MTNHNEVAGTVLYEAGKSTVKTLDIIAKGSIRASNDYCSIELSAGSVLGIGELPGANYIFTYEVSEDVTYFSYPYESEASLVSLFKTNPKLLSTLVAGSIRFARKLQSAVLDTLEYARTEYAGVQRSLEEYPALAISLGFPVQDYTDVKMLPAPEMLDKARGWHRDFVEDLNANEALFRKDFYSIPSIGLGIGLTVNQYALESRDFMNEVTGYLGDFSAQSRVFRNQFQLLKEQSLAAQSGSQEHVSGALDDSVNDFRGALMKFTEIDPEICDRFFLNISTFAKNPDRYGSDDSIRSLRRDISMDFYEIYYTVFIASTKQPWDAIPLGVRMFLLFGYVNRELAGDDNAVKLSSIAQTLQPNSESKILTMYEWLLLIYNGKIMPSKNEFDLDYPSYLRDLKRNGSINDADEKRLLDSLPERLRYEIKNLFATGNRLTFGRITTFVPIFDRENVLRAPEQCYQNVETITAQLDAIRKIDYGVFCRQGVFSMPEAGVNAFYTTDEILPYVILMPNVGSRATLWQEIDAKRRNTPARMILSIFHTEDIQDTIIRLAGEFRWDMCKTEQGAHWNDVTDPSLTAMYFDYLQFYRKNSGLSQDAKDKVSIALKNNANNFKKVFVSDYCAYIKYESQGALRLNKVARGILFSFCPFSQEIMKVLGENPQFTQQATKHAAEVVQKQKIIRNLIVKIEKAGYPVPDKIKEQAEFLQNRT